MLLRFIKKSHSIVTIIYTVHGSLVVPCIICLGEIYKAVTSFFILGKFYYLHVSGVRVPLRSRHFLSLNLRHFHENIRSWVENECCCPRTVNISNVNFTSKMSLGQLMVNTVVIYTATATKLFCLGRNALMNQTEISPSDSGLCIKWWLVSDDVLTLVALNYFKKKCWYICIVLIY